MTKKLRIRLIISVILTAILLGISLFGLVAYSVADVGLRRQQMVHNKAEDLATQFENMIDMGNDLFGDYADLDKKGFDIIVMMLKELFRDDVYYGPEFLDDGVVVRYEDGQVYVPDVKGIVIKEFKEEWFEQDYYELMYFEDDDDEIFNVAIQRLEGPYFYVSWTSYDEYFYYMQNSAVYVDTLHKNEKAYGGYLVVTSDDGYYSFNGLTGTPYETEDLDLSKAKQGDSFSIELGNTNFLCGYKRIESMKMDLYFLQPVQSMYSTVINRIVIFANLSWIIYLTMLTWNYAVVRLVDSHILTAEQQKNYRPVRVRRINLIAAALGGLLVFAAVHTTQILDDLIMFSENGKNIIDIISEENDSESAQDEFINNEIAEWNVYYAQKVAELCGPYPALRDREILKDITDILEIQYLVLYDENGQQLMCSENYRGLTLEGDMSDFMSLTNGKYAIVKKDFDDHMLESKVLSVGVPMPMTDDELYGVVVLNSTNYKKSIFAANFSNRVRSMIQDGDLFLVVDKEDGMIIDSTDYNFLGTYASAYDIDMEAKDLMNYFNINGNRYYGISKESGDNILYYFIDASAMSNRSGVFSLVAAIVFVIIYLIVTFIVIKRYDNKFFEENVLTGKDPIRDMKIAIDTAGGKNKRTTEVSKRYEFILQMWKDMLPERKAMTVFIIVLISLLIERYTESDSVSYVSILGYIIQGNWKRGINIFALTSIGLLSTLIILIMIIVRIIFVILIRIFDTKGETICRLVYNFIQYLAFFCFLYYAFGYLGINTTALLASAGFISLAISLGSRDLVSDILAGLTIVFEGDFQVGDMVSIGGYRGQVTEIGVRSTKLLGRGNNIKVISNRDIRDVINMTKMNSWLPIEIVIDAEKIDEAEKLLEENLSVIGKKNDRIINGPYYYGILKVADGKMTLSIMTECREEDYNKVQRFLNRELYLLLKSKQIPMK